MLSARLNEVGQAHLNESFGQASQYESFGQAVEAQANASRL